MKNISKSLWGIVFVLIGLFIGLNSFGILDINLFLMDGGHYLLLFHVLLDYLILKMEENLEI